MMASPFEASIQTTRSVAMELPVENVWSRAAIIVIDQNEALARRRHRVGRPGHQIVPAPRPDRARTKSDCWLAFHGTRHRCARHHPLLRAPSVAIPMTKLVSDRSALVNGMPAL